MPLAGQPTLQARASFFDEAQNKALWRYPPMGLILSLPKDEAVLTGRAKSYRSRCPSRARRTASEPSTFGIFVGLT